MQHMRIRIPLFLTATLLLFFTACNSETAGEQSNSNATSETRYEDMAAELCTCMQPLADLYEKVLAATEAGDEEKALELMNEFQAASDTGEQCAAQLEEKYGDFKGEEEEKKAQIAVEKACPKIAEMIGGD